MSARHSGKATLETTRSRGSEDGEGLESGVFGVCNRGKQLTCNVLYLNFRVNVRLSALKQEFYV